MSNGASEFIAPAEDHPRCSPREAFARYGYAPLPPSELDDRQLPGRLWELLYAAAARRFFFCGTGHLGDRSLYTLLWEQWLDKPTADIPPEAETNTTTVLRRTLGARPARSGASAGPQPARGLVSRPPWHLGRRRCATLAALLCQRRRARQAREGMPAGHTAPKRKAVL
jgi:hypothetical protein